MPAPLAAVCVWSGWGCCAKRIAAKRAWKLSMCDSEADDAALISEGTAEMTERLDSIGKGSIKDADMVIHMGKTKTMHVRHQPAIAPPTIEEIKKTEGGYKHECEFCERRFKTNRGRKIHQSSCNNWHGLTVDEFPVEKVTATFGTPSNRWFLVK